MIISTKQGRRGKHDRIVIIKTNGYETMSLQGLLEIIQLFMENEDRVHPRTQGRKGRWMLYEAISDVANGMNFMDVTQKYLSPKYKKNERG